jgi:subtilisin family serine protease
MLKYLTIILCLISTTVFAGTKVDPLLRMLAERPALAKNVFASFGAKAVGGVQMADAFVKAEKGRTGEVISLIEDNGGEVRTVAGDIMTAVIPIKALQILEASPAVVYIEAAKPMRAKMDYARSLSQADKVQTGSGTTGGSTYRGSGVVVGVADSGIDCTHADFAGRILAYWDQAGSGNAPSEIDNSYGYEYTGSGITDGACGSAADSSRYGHGSHVTGIAAGGDATFTGIAPEAEIISVRLDEPDFKGNTYSAYTAGLSTKVTDGVNYMFKKAQESKKPIVVNLSIGTSLGAHDGTSLFESSLDGLLIDSTTNAEKFGRAIVNAAGNENAAVLQSNIAGGIHALINVSNTTKAFEFLPSSNSNYPNVTDFGGSFVDIWLDAGSSCTVKLKGYRNDSASDRTNTSTSNKSDVAATTGAVAAGSPAVTAEDAYGMSVSIDFTDDENANNGKQHAFATATAGTDETFSKYSFDLVFTGTCTGHAWLYYDSVNYHYFTKNMFTINPFDGSYAYVAGDSDYTTTIPATAGRVIVVGSYMARDEWTGGGGQSQIAATGGTVGNISTFSSLGPTSGGTTKPDVAAPGEPIVSTKAWTASSNPGDGTHKMLYGTSMASPHTAGTVALMLQKNGCLRQSEIKEILQEQADVPEGVDSLPDNTWGYGKLNALDSVNAVTAADCAPDNPGDDSSGGGGGSSSSGCANIAGTASSPILVAFFIFFGLLSALHGAKTHKKGRSK